MTGTGQRMVRWRESQGKQKSRLMGACERAGMLPLFPEANPPERINYDSPNSLVELMSIVTCAFFPGQNPGKVTRSPRKLVLEIILHPSMAQEGSVYPRSQRGG